MKTTKITINKALELIKSGKFNLDLEIDFDNNPIDAIDAILLSKNGVIVPEENIFYNDDNIDYSDIPPITDEDIINEKIKIVHKAEFPIRNEIEDWLNEEKIDVNNLLSDLIENFYKTIQNINKHAALY